MKAIKGLLAAALLMLPVYLLIFKTSLFIYLILGLFCYAGFSHWIFRNLSGRYMWAFKLILFLTILFIFIGGFYLQWQLAIMFTGKFLAWLMVLLPIIILFFAYQEKKGKSL